VSVVVLELERVKAAVIKEVARCGLGAWRVRILLQQVTHHVPVFSSFFFFSGFIIDILYYSLEHETERS
jgi:hypothetical protein